MFDEALVERVGGRRDALLAAGVDDYRGEVEAFGSMRTTSLARP